MNEADNNMLPQPKRTFYSIYIKRWLDVFLSTAALTVLSPLLLAVCLLELLIHGRPILYSTPRPGKDGKIFRLYKFRSMTNERGEDGLLLPDSQRLTKFGHFIRKTSIDELPSLINILKGDMAVVGPRPLLVEYLDYYGPRYSMRHSVRPGLTCPRVIQTESNTWTWREQFENDIYYVEHVSFPLDVKMVFGILKAVLLGSETRASSTRIPFDENTLDETRDLNELHVEKHFDSLEHGEREGKP